MLIKITTVSARIIALMLFLFTSAVFAETTVFGLTLGKTTRAEIKNLYPDVTSTGVSSWTEQPMLKVRPADVQFEGLKTFEILLDDQDKVTAVFLTITGSKFDFTQKSLSKKYKVVRRIIPFVGNKFVSYVNGKDVIELNAPHMSFDMRLMYIEKKTNDIISRKMKQAESNKKHQEASQL